MLLNAGTLRPVFIWDAPGIGKTAIVEEFALEVGLDCLSLLGNLLAHEDISRVPLRPPGAVQRSDVSCAWPEIQK